MKNVILLVLFMAVFIIGCDDRTPYGLNKRARPLTIIAINEKGVIISDGDGNFHVYHQGYYFSKVLIKNGFKAGDILGEVK